MTDEELIEELQNAESFMVQYKAVAERVAFELAKRKSMAVFGVEGGYTGDLGCWEAGADTICLHITDSMSGKHFTRPEGDKIYYQSNSELSDKSHDFEKVWYEKMQEAGIVSIWLTGHH
jgi:hypothetical protein